jgi:hypothetical protein
MVCGRQFVQQKFPRIVAGVAIINGVAAAIDYATGVTVKNAIDVPAGPAPEQITSGGIAISALLNNWGSDCVCFTTKSCNI